MTHSVDTDVNQYLHCELSTDGVCVSQWIWRRSTMYSRYRMTEARLGTDRLPGSVHRPIRFERSISIGCRDTEWDTRICNPLMGTLKPQSNGPLYSNTVTGTLAVDEWAVTLVQRGGTWAGCGPAQSPPRCTKCNSPPINGQCTNFMLFDAAL